MQEAKWQVGPVEIMTTSGPNVIAGWVNGRFGIAPRSVLLTSEEAGA